ncbi:MAG: DEAD/DEAH box helicase, partial [Candidatus Sabulitectum sp.]|nr:DEAD/DEAH box helicase [Candidatus Sabulitectum sp.]
MKDFLIVTVAPGARILVRDAEWVVRRVDRTSTGGQAISAVGISELVRDKEAVFLTEIEQQFKSEIQILKPEETILTVDESPQYHSSILYMESLLRRKPPTDEMIYTGHKGAMDSVDYQFDPAIQALEQPRQRILIADAVGLGKTLEAGILVSELIRRGRGKRILVVALKSMLTQFQKEWWSRFTIPLTRLDSIGIQRIRSRIPTNSNPFYYYDKAIISIDTLKQDTEYRNYLEKSWWDIIVIDEAQNVAERGSKSSQRAKLAKLLAEKSDTLIMLSATPHDGRAKSFASLMNMLDPTAIADEEEYTKDDIKGLFIRRFKKDIKHQVKEAFKKRKIYEVHVQASPQEEEAYNSLKNINFTKLNEKRSGSILFKTTLQKALFSSPAACIKTIENRIKKLRKTEDPAYYSDIAQLEKLMNSTMAITPECFSKYRKLVSLLKSSEYNWNRKSKKDRLVVFTERIETLKFLHKELTRDLKLKDSQVEILHGGMSDIEQQRIVEDFGGEDAPVRVLLASDVASEGINLHYLSHRMIHFDIPWSLMVFKQRNGRIDRYGQSEPPRIDYLLTDSTNPEVKGDIRILQLLIEKDEQAAKNIGDPASFMNLYDIEEEEKFIARAIEEKRSAEDLNNELNKNIDFDPLKLLMGNTPQPIGESAKEKTASLPSLFKNNYSYLKTALDHINQTERLDYKGYEDEKRLELTLPEDLKQRYRRLPREVYPKEHTVVLSEDINLIKKEIINCRRNETAWPEITYNWELHPVLDWVNDRMLAAFGRHQAPVITLHSNLEPDETIFIISGLIPNRKGQPIVHDWFGVRFRGSNYIGTMTFSEVLNKTELHKR